MDSFGGFSCEGEWDLYGSSILSLEELDFTPIIPLPTAGNIIPDANWFNCSLDSFTANLNFPASVFGANSRDEYDTINSIDHQLPCIDVDHHISMSTGEIEEKKMEYSILSACSDILLQEITANFSGEDRFVNMDDIASNPTNPLHYKRKFTVVHDDHRHHNKLNNPPKRIRTSSNNAQKSRKAAESDGKTSQKLSTRRRKCEELDQENGGCDMNSCSSANSEDDNASQETNGDAVLEPAKAKTRASRGSATDPQSLYARKRRERINERLRILQKLVPNGTKVDISTMLEEAVHYVKFLQLQIKLLSSDELWMYAPIAYNGMDIGLQQKLSSFL